MGGLFNVATSSVLHQRMLIVLYIVLMLLVPHKIGNAFKDRGSDDLFGDYEGKLRFQYDIYYW